MCCDGPRDPGTFLQDDITEREREREREQEPESCLTLAALVTYWFNQLPVIPLAAALPPPINGPLIVAAVLQGKFASLTHR